MREGFSVVRATAERLDLVLSEKQWRTMRVLHGLWAGYARSMNLVGPGQLETQMGESLHLVAAVQRWGGLSGPWLDLGSGGGFPGLVLSACLGVDGFLVEPRQKRCDFLELALRQTNSSWRVVRARADRGRVVPATVGCEAGTFGGASARAVWAPDTWAEEARPWLRPGGVFAVHQHVGDPSPVGLVPVAVVDGEHWSVRLFSGEA